MSQPAVNEGVDKTIHVRNINYATTEDALREAFKQFGEVKDVRIITDYDARERLRVSRGFGFVEFQTQKGYTDALACKDPIDVDGRTLRLSQARPRQPRKRDTAFIGGIPKGTTPDDLKAAFAQYGPTDVRIIRENNETGPGFAIVTFDTEEHQTEAVKNNRSIRLKGEDSIVKFSRKGPRRSGFRRPPPRRRAEKENVPRPPRAARGGARPAAPPPAAEDQEGLARRVLVGNIAWVTTGQGLGTAFTRFGDIQMVRIETRQDSVTGEEVSRGRGFVEFKTVQGCQSALDFKDPIEVDGRKLRIEPAQQKGGRPPARRSSQWDYRPGRDDGPADTG
jgi:RNA recognition motif-containing protein